VINKKGAASEVPSGVTIGILFSSSWCPDCTPFAATLKEFYNKVNAVEKTFEVVYVSSDNTKSQMMPYYNAKHADWLAVNFDDDEFRSELKRKYGACAGAEQEDVGVEERKHGIPTLCIVKPDGTLITDTAAKDVNGCCCGPPSTMPPSWTAA